MELDIQEILLIRKWGDEAFDKHGGFTNEELDLWDKLHNELVNQKVAHEESHRRP